MLGTQLDPRDKNLLSPAAVHSVRGRPRGPGADVIAVRIYGCRFL